MAKKLTIKELKGQLKDFSQDELIYLISKLYKNSGEALKIINSELLGDEYNLDLLVSAKADVYKVFFPTRLSSHLSIANAKKILSTFDRCCPNTVMQIDLKLYFVECGVEFTNTFGDINGSFYNSLESMFWKVADLLNDFETEEAFITFEKRLITVVRESEGIGWGFYDDLSDALCSIKWFDA